MLNLFSFKDKKNCFSNNFNQSYGSETSAQNGFFNTIGDVYSVGLYSGQTTFQGTFSSGTGAL